MKTKIFLSILLIFICLAFTSEPTCGDETVYANSKQTANDNRFKKYKKIKDVPKFKGGERKLENIIRNNLELAEDAKSQIFNLNYQFTLTCEGKIKDVVQIGDPIADNWTNIETILKDTESDWKVAKKDGEAVNCIYFGKIFINGSQF